MTLCQRHGQSGVFVVDDGRLGRRREPRGSRQGGRPRAGPCSGPRDHEQSRRERGRGRDACRAPGARRRPPEDGRVAVLRDEELVGVVSRADLLRELEGARRAARRAGGRPSPQELRAAASAARRSSTPIAALGGPRRRRLPRRRNRPGHPPGRGELRRRHRGRGRRDRLRLRARAGARRPCDAAPEVRDRGRLLRRRRARSTSSPRGPSSTTPRARCRPSSAQGCARISSGATSRSTRWPRPWRANDFGRLVDPFGGRADLEARVLRVLHNLSFIDDPTRIFRGIRYEARYGLRFDEHSARARCGVASRWGSSATSRPSRLRDELVALLEDPAAADGIRRLGELGADRAIHPHLRGDDVAARTLRASASPSATSSASMCPTWRIGLAALAHDLTSDEAYDWLERLKVRRRDVERIVGAVTVAPRIVERLRAERARSRPGRRPRRSHSRPDAPLLALAREDRPELRDYFARLRDVTPRDRRCAT